MANTIAPLRAGCFSRRFCRCGRRLVAQTEDKVPEEPIYPQQDVEGPRSRGGSAEAVPINQNEKIANYLTKLGDRLVAAAPAELKQPVYEDSFTPVNVKEINAFALPGGPMFRQSRDVRCGRRRGEVVGVMAHELSHVLLRHGLPRQRRRIRGSNSASSPARSVGP